MSKRTIWFALGVAGTLTALVVSLVLFGVVGGSAARLLPAIELSSVGDRADTAGDRADMGSERTGTGDGAPVQEGRSAADATVPPTAVTSGPNEVGDAGGTSGSRGRETVVGPVRSQGAGSGTGTQQVKGTGGAPGGSR